MTFENSSWLVSKSVNARDIKVSIIFNLLLAKVIILLWFFFFFLVTFNNFLTLPVVAVNITVKDAPAVPTGIPTIVACDTTLKVPNDADSVIKSLSAYSKATIYLLSFLTISFLSLISEFK